MSILDFEDDRYNGVVINRASLPSKEDDFTHKLTLSLEKWKTDGKRAIWMEIPSNKSSLIPVAIEKFGFDFHHADETALMLVKWLPKEPHRLPPCASHQVGIGAFVMNEDGAILAVQECSGPLKGTGVWKIPTGLLDRGEDIPDGAIREVLEETGVSCAFQAVICIRQAHGFFFGNSDLFFLCALKPLPGPIQLRKQNEEIEDVRWCPFNEFMAQEFFTKRESIRLMMMQCKRFGQGEENGFIARSMQITPNRRDLLLWLNNGFEINESKM
eukprot:g1170.t1